MEKTYRTDPEAEWVFVVDQLNTHQSETLVRRLLKRASFSSTQELEERLLAFIDYFNEMLAKPFAWTYTGLPLRL